MGRYAALLAVAMLVNGLGCGGSDGPGDDPIDQTDGDTDTTDDTTNAVCGNGTVEDGEGCDAGGSNTDNPNCAYGEQSCSPCSSTCTALIGVVVGYCGNSTTETVHGEACDDGNTVTEVCAYDDESCMVCNATCLLVGGANGVCGDGIIQPEYGESCDDHTNALAECSGEAATCPACSGATCKSVTSAALTFHPETALAIPDGNADGVCASLDGSALTGTVEDLWVRVAISHTFIGDLKLVLVAPSETTMVLLDRPGYPASGDGDGSNLSSTYPVTFIGNAVTAAEAMGANPSTNEVCHDDGICTFTPEQPVATLRGTSAVGTWKVCFYDAAAVDAGNVSEVRLQLGLRP